MPEVFIPADYKSGSSLGEDTYQASAPTIEHTRLSDLLEMMRSLHTQSQAVLDQFDAFQAPASARQEVRPDLDEPTDRLDALSTYVRAAGRNLSELSAKMQERY